MKVCLFDDCESPHYGRGWCSMHYQRWARHGDPSVVVVPVPRVCSVDGCDGPHHGRGWCRKHHARWVKKGDPTSGRRSVAERFESKVCRTGDGCWLWGGYVLPNGYGTFSENGQQVYAHRWSYEHHVGPIPEGLHIDHVYELGCRHRHCVNPDHLEPVTPAENNRRAAAVGA